MLARAPQNFPECFKLSIKPSKTPRLFELFCSRSAGKHGLRCCDFSRRRTIWPKKRVSVRACYTRKQLETPGAYQLINNETGEKVIVWGDADDDSPIPSDEVLSWNPKTKSSGTSRKEDTKKKTTAITNANEGGVKADTAVNNSGEPLGGLARSFGRLKAQRVRTLIDKSSRVKQENVEYDTGESVLEDTPFDKAVSSDLEVEYVARKSYVGAVRHRGSISKASQSQETKDTTFDKTVSSDSEVKYVARKSNVGAVRHRGSISKVSLSQETKDKPFDKTVSSDSEVELVRKSNVGAVRYRGSISKASYPLETKDKMQASKQEVPISRSVADTRRGWGNGEPTQSTRFDSIDVLNQRRKRFSNDGFFSRKSFRDLGCSDDMIESLRGQLFLRPSHIQAMAFVPVNEGKSCIIADQSGSGKTLAYLAPVIQRLRQEELQGVRRSSPRSPRVIVLVPTAELASQVLSNCRSISKYGVPFRSMVVTGGFRQRTQLENLQQNLDVLIATPGRFIFLLKEGFLQLTNLMCAVLDEVDILFSDEEFEQALQSLISSAPMTTQYLFATATLPVEIYNKLVEIFPDCKVIMGPGMHRTSSGLEEILVDCSGDDAAERSPDTAFLNKKAALLQLVEESPVSKTIVFCNKIETCRKVENVLKRFDRKEYRIRVLPFHAALDQELRLANMKDFLNTPSKEDSLFLICTDRASRGIDFVGVDHVVLFDFPRDPSEYVRRVGRTARGAGGEGKAFVFVVGKQVSLARRIIERNKRGHPLHDVPSAYELVS